ncbi:octopamine receptor 1-like [Mya arenaria]|uniref:octopamine receptor 1-like n=1 Tax=Mya arenaria TaxID=6604 RepID=UPI0022DF4DBF|nr:octopamine receptor 1-like [Mya arenaria]
MDSETYHLIWHIAYIAIMIPIVIGNGLILISIARFPRLRTNMHLLIGNLAVSDLIVGALLIPYSLITREYVNRNMYICFGKLCLFVFSLGSSCYNLMLISLERFVSITFPLHCKTYMTLPRLGALIAFGWAITLFNGTLPMYGWHIYSENNTQCVSDTLWTQAYKHMVNWELIVSLLINFALYSMVARIALRKACDRTQIKAGLTVHAKYDRDVHQILTLVIVLGLFAICWLPYAAVVVIVTFHETPTWQYVRRCTLIPGIINSAVNWVVYGFRNEDFRKAFKSILSFKRNSETSVSSSQTA